MRDYTSALAATSVPVRRYQRAQVVTVHSANRLTVKLDADAAATVTIPAVSSSPSYAVNDLVVVARDSSGPFVAGRLGAGPPPPGDTGTAPPVAPGGTKTRRQATILPSSSATWRGRWLDGDELRQGDWGYGHNTGAAFYGRQLVGLGADLGSPASAVLRYSRQAGGVFGAQAPTFWTLAQAARPSGPVTRLSSGVGTAVAVDRQASWQLPAGMLAELLDGTAGGLGIYVAGSSPYIILSGRTRAATSMSLTVDYFA